MSGPHGLFISGPYAASTQVGGQGSARWFSKIIHPAELFSALIPRT